MKGSDIHLDNLPKFEAAGRQQGGGAVLVEKQAVAAARLKIEAHDNGARVKAGGEVAGGGRHAGGAATVSESRIYTSYTHVLPRLSSRELALIGWRAHPFLNLCDCQYWNPTRRTMVWMDIRGDEGAETRRLTGFRAMSSFRSLAVRRLRSTPAALYTSLDLRRSLEWWMDHPKSECEWRIAHFLPLPDWRVSASALVFIWKSGAHLEGGPLVGVGEVDERERCHNTAHKVALGIGHANTVRVVLGEDLGRAVGALGFIHVRRRVDVHAWVAVNLGRGGTTGGEVAEEGGLDEGHVGGDVDDG